MAMSQAQLTRDIMRRKEEEVTRQRQKVAQNMVKVAIDLEIEDLEFATAASMYHWFLDSDDPLNADPRKIAIAAFWVVLKSSDNPVRLGSIVNAFELMAHGGDVHEAAIFGFKEYWKIRDELLLYEHAIMSCIGFNTRLVSHFAYLINFCKYVNADAAIVQSSHAVLMDTFTMSCCIRYGEAELAFGALTLAIHALGAESSVSDVSGDMTRFVDPLRDLQKNIRMNDRRKESLANDIIDGYGGKLDEACHRIDFDRPRSYSSQASGSSQEPTVVHSDDDSKVVATPTQTSEGTMRSLPQSETNASGDRNAPVMIVGAQKAGGTFASLANAYEDADESQAPTPKK